jgi:predicted enzyme related to lactoylglutathione lyase
MTDFSGLFVWYELMTTDTKAAEKFYRDVVGWGAKDADVPDMAYTMFQAGETPVAGLITIPERVTAAGGRPGWMGYVAVDNVDAAAAQVADAGGGVHHAPEDIPNVGRFAVFADPQGAVLALFNGVPSDNEPTIEPDKPGFIGWHELFAGDWQAAFDFYAGLFGWTKGDAMDMGPMGTYQTFGPASGNAFGGMMNKPEHIPAPYWRYYFNVDAIDAAKDRVETGGGQVLFGPTEVPGDMWVVNCLDLQGAEFSLIAPKR